MNKLKGLAVSFALMSVLAVTTFAGETPTPPCAPGETSGPPCAAQPMNDDAPVLGETAAPPALPVVYVTDIAETMLWSLLLF
ncbi:MAG: hypothetical protein WAM70_18040 [Pyrinomonadaceae bacterium]